MDENVLKSTLGWLLKIGGTFLGVPILRIVMFWGSILGPTYLGEGVWSW